MQMLAEMTDQQPSLTEYRMRIFSTEAHTATAMGDGEAASENILVKVPRSRPRPTVYRSTL